jgi:hypothetical protein
MTIKLGDTAPDFMAETTEGTIKERSSLIKTFYSFGCKKIFCSEFQLSFSL